MNADEAWNLVEMIKSYFDNRAKVDDIDHPNKEMQFAQACEKIMSFLEKLP